MSGTKENIQKGITRDVGKAKVSEANLKTQWSAKTKGLKASEIKYQLQQVLQTD